MDNFTSSQITSNAFLGGRLQIAQPKTGYRAGVDPVLLGAATPAKAGQSVLDLGCGAGVAGLCVAARVSGIQLFGVEIQPAYADLARQNGTENAIDCSIWNADIRDLPRDVREQRFDHVIANPPYFQKSDVTRSPDLGRDLSLAEDIGMSIWAKTASKRLVPGGIATFIQRIDRLPELLAAFDSHFGTISVMPIAPRVGKPPNLFLISGRKGGKGAFQLLPALILHKGERHEKDGDDYTEEVSAVLREAAPIFWPR